MHTQVKWIIEKDTPLDAFGEDLKEIIYIMNKDDRYDTIICEIESSSYSDSNAKRIVQTHNSFDDLLEACSLARDFFDVTEPDKLTVIQGGVNWHEVYNLLRIAIAKAE